MPCTEKACAFPVERDGLCVYHLRDREEIGRPFTDSEHELATLLDVRLPVGNQKPEERARAAELLKLGKSVATVAGATGLSKGTILSVRQEIVSELPDHCECGRPLGHRGWCRGRVQASPARKEMLAKLHKEQKRAPAAPPANYKVYDRAAKSACATESAPMKFSYTAPLDCLRGYKEFLEKNLSEVVDAIETLEEIEKNCQDL